MHTVAVAFVNAGAVNDPSAATSIGVRVPFCRSTALAPAGIVPVTWTCSSIHWNV